jgi:hypothetical protein
METLKLILQKIGVGVLLIAIIALSAFITGLVAMLLWNWLMPVIFGLPTITFIQGWGLAFLCGILFPRVNLNKD